MLTTVIYTLAGIDSFASVSLSEALDEIARRQLIQHRDRRGTFTVECNGVPCLRVDRSGVASNV